MPEQHTRKSVSGIIPTLARLTMIGWLVGISIAGGASLGWWLDGLVGSAPLLLEDGNESGANFVAIQAVTSSWSARRIRLRR